MKKIRKLLRRKFGPPARTPLPVIHMHIQKTAGTSFVEMAWGSSYRKYNDQFLSHGDFLTIDESQIKKTLFVSGHFGFTFAHRHLKSQFGDRELITFLREPKSRILSLYKFCQQTKLKNSPLYSIAKEVSLDDFLRLALRENEARDPLIFAHLWNHQAYQLYHGFDPADLTSEDTDQARPTLEEISEEDLKNAAIEHLTQMSFVGFSETFDKDALLLFERLLGGPPPKPLHSNASVPLALSELPSTTIKLLDALTFVDRTVYNYALREFRRIP